MLADARSRLHRLTPEEADAARAKGAFLVDIRPAAQRAAEGELPSATPIERNVLEWRLDPASDASLPIASHDLEVVVLCQEGYTSSLAAAALQELGIHRATDVIGGYAAWRAGQLRRKHVRRAATQEGASGPPRAPPQWPGPTTILARSDSCAPPLAARVVQASSMSRARVSTCSRLIVSLTRARMIVTSWASGGSV